MATNRPSMVPESKSSILSGGNELDLRLLWMAQYISTCFPDIPEDAVVYFFKENKKLFQEYLDEKKVFKSLFFQNIYDPTKDERRIKQMEREADLKRRADERERRAEMRRRRLAELAEGGEEIVDQFVDEEESEEDEEDELYFGPPPIPLKLYADKITDWFHPFDVCFVYFTRLDRGPISEPTSIEMSEAKMSTMLLKGCVDRDPLQMLYELLDSHNVVKNADPSKNFEDKYIIRFYKRIKSLAGRVEGELTLNIPRDIRSLYAAPFSAEVAANDPDSIKKLNDCCYEWIQSVEKVLKDITKDPKAEKKKENKKDELLKSAKEEELKTKPFVVGKTDNEVLKEIEMWEERLRRFEGLEAQLKMNAVERSLMILHTAGNVHAKTLTDYIEEIKNLHEEAQDNVKFLSTIRKPTEILVKSNNCKEMRTTLPNLMNSLRNIWMLSKHFNTDEQICSLLDKITNIILGRIRSFVDFKLLHQPVEAERISKEAQSLLTGWDESFQKTRRAIEESGREARWEFSVQKQFSQVHHASKVCTDIAEVANILSQFQCCYTDALIECTSKPDLIIKAKQRTYEMTESFAKLVYDAFDPANAHHWQNQIDWFHREVRFVDAESASIAEEVFDHLLLSKLAIDALHSMIKTNYRKDIGRRFVAKVGLIIKKFTLEIKDDEVMFRSKKSDPPIAENLPPISGAIYWSNDIEKNLAQTLNSLSAVVYVTQHKSWPKALECYHAFLNELHKYKMHRYDEWRYRVSDILDANLTRNLLLTLPPEENSCAERYLVNFTTDLSDTLAEVKHLEHLGFTVPEVARNMSLQEGKLTGIAADLRKLVEKYHGAIDSIQLAEEELMLPELKITQTSLTPGHSRLTWNSMGIKEFIAAGNQQISSLISKIRQIEILRVQLQEIVDYVSKKNLLKLMADNQDKAIQLPAFDSFFKSTYDYLERMYKDVLAKVSLMAPLLIKVEEILVASRTRKATRLSSYYHHWERKLFDAVVEMTNKNLEEYSQFLRQKTPQFTLRSLLQMNDVILEPEAAFVLDGAVKVVRNMLQNTKRFVRFYKGSCIPVKPVYITGYIDRVLPSFYEDISCLPEIVKKVEVIQNTLVDILKMMFTYLNEWKGYRSIWRYDKDMTCAKFLKLSPTCVDFDEKLLFYYNLRRAIESAVDVKDFRCIRMQLRPLKDGILGHIDQWICTLGKLLEQTAWERLEKITYKVDDYSSRLKELRHSNELEKSLILISDIWDMSLEFEIDYMDIQERCRTLDMYGIKSEKNIVSLSADLPNTWNNLYVKSKEIYFRINELKAKNCKVILKRVERLAKKLRELWEKFRTEGPSSMELDAGLSSLLTFRNQLDIINKHIIEINEYQKVLKQPLSNFEVFTILKTEFANLEEIFKVFQELQDTTNRIENLTCDVYFADPAKFSLVKIEKQIEALKERFGNHVVLQKLESRMRSFANYQKIIYLLNNDKLRPRHWQIMQDKTGIYTDEEYLSFKMNIFLGLNQDAFKNIIVDAIEVAQEEARIEEELTVIRLRWDERKFILTREPITKTGSGHKLTIINQINSLNEEVEQDDSVIDTMIHSSKSTFFRPDLEKMKGILAEITAILKTWISTQENCLVLARVLLTFVSADFREIDDIRLLFEEDFKSYNKLMEEVAKKPIVSKCCLLPERRKMLKDYKIKFLAHKKACRRLIELKQKSLPRLSFLSDQESLILLGGLTGDGDTFQKVARKIIGQGMKTIIFEETKFERDDPKTSETVGSIETVNGECLAIYRHVDCRNATDVWLSQLIDEIRKSVKNIMRRALKESVDMNEYSFDDYTKTVELVSIAKFNVMWTNQVESIFESDQPMDNIKNIYQSLTGKVATLCKQVIHVCEDGEETKMQKARNLLNIFLSKRNQLFLFLQKNITSSDDFGWKSSFRLVWRKDHDDVEARQGCSLQKFGYEYQAALKVPIETESTLKSQFAIFSSLHEYRPIYLKGSIYSGKTACVSELAYRLGRYLVFLDLHAEFTPNDMVNSLQGLCRANCWAHYDGVDLLDYETLSILTTQLQQINLAQSMNLKEFHLSGKKTQLGLQTGFFFLSRNCETLLDGEGGQSRMKLPPISLSSQFRQVFIQTPNQSPIIQAALLSKGFGSPKSLTASLLAIVETFYKITSGGFRLIPKFSIIREIFSRLPDGAKVEQSHIANAIMSTMKAVLPAKDMDIIGPFVREHFSESLVEANPATTEQTSNNSPHGDFTKDLSHRISKNLWPLVIGPRFAGKTTTISSAVKQLEPFSTSAASGTTSSLTSGPYTVFEVKLARHSVRELFGLEDDSGKWNFGIISRFFASNTKPCVIVLVTPISSSVAHHFASIFDRGYFQTDSNHSFAIPRQVRFVFETTDISSVSPLLLARCSIMYLPIINDKLSFYIPKIGESTTLETAANSLMIAINAFPLKDDVKNTSGKLIQLNTIFSLLMKNCEKDDTNLISNFVYAFCWSYGGAIINETDVTRFDSAIRKVFKEVDIFQKSTLQEKCTIFQQRYDSTLKMWVDMESPFAAIMEIITLLVENDQPVIIVGELETRLVLRSLENKLLDDQQEKKIVVNMTLSSEMKKSQCLENILSHLERKGEMYMQPPEGKKLVAIIRQLESRKVSDDGNLLTMLADLCKNKNIYTKDNRRKKIQNVAMIGQIVRSKGMELLATFDEVNYFNILAAKGCTPNAIIMQQNSGDLIPQKLLDSTLTIHDGLVKAFSDSNNPDLDSPAKLLSLKNLDNVIRCLNIQQLHDETAIKKEWATMLYQNLYLPLWSSKDRQKVKDILLKCEVDLSEAEKDGPEGGSVFDRTLFEVDRLHYSNRKLIVLVGAPGSGKRSAIMQSCKEGGIDLHQFQVDPTKPIEDWLKSDTKNGDNINRACIINGHLFTSLDNPLDVDRYIQETKQKLLPIPNLLVFMTLSITDIKENVLKRLLYQLQQESCAIIGVPPWKESDLRICLDDSSLALSPETLLKIHVAIEGFGNGHLKPAMLSLAHKVTNHRIKAKSSTILGNTNRLRTILGKLEALDKLVDESEKQLTKIMDELAKDEQMRNKMNEDKENTKLTLETTSEQKTSLKRQIPDFQRQVDVRQNDLTASSQKRHAIYEKAVEDLNEKTSKEIEKFCTRINVPSEVEVICSAILVITEGMKYPESGEPMYVWNHFRAAYIQEEWRKQFFSIDPERHGLVTAFFLERRMKELRKLGMKRSVLTKEEPFADALLEFCEGFLEIINTVEDRIELESRFKVYEEMFANMNSEVERLQNTEDSLNEQLKTLTQKVEKTEEKMTVVQDDINERKGRLQMAQQIASSLTEQRKYWSDQLKSLQDEKNILEERETVLACASIYLMELPQAQREIGLEVIMDAASCSGKYAHLKSIIDPCQRKNILFDNEFLGWQERIIKKLCVVYDPHNILLELFVDKEVSLHYIEELEDLAAIKEAIDGASEGDTLVLMYGSNVDIISDVIREIKKMCSTSVAVFLCLSQWTPLPSRVTFVNLDMRGKELRKMALHLFSVKRQPEKVEKSGGTENEVKRKLKMDELKLMNIITSSDSLTKRFKEIIELSAKMDEHRNAMKTTQVDAEVEDHVSTPPEVVAADHDNLQEQVYFPISIISACCDMSTIADRPFMSLENFVNFTWTRLQDKELTLEETHKIIFQRYCLAFSDRDQLLFQSLIIIHYNILQGNYTENDFKDFLNVVAGHEKKEFPLSCPDWCKATDWHHLKKLISEVNYHHAHIRLERDEDQWKHWYENSMDHSFDNDDFVTFLIKCALKQNLLPIHFGQFVSNHALAAMEVPSNLCLDYVHSFSTSISPILLYIDQNAIEDPTFHLKKLADVQGIAATKVKYFALGAGNGNVACSLLDTAFVRGQWLIFQNLQLVPNIIVALQRRIDEAKDIHEDFRLWFTWQHTPLPQLQLLQKSIVINCQPIRAIRYHTKTFVYSLDESIFDSESTKRNIISCLLELHRRWEWSCDYAPFYWHAAFRMHSTNILHEMSIYAEHFSPDAVSTTSGGVRRRVTGEQLHDRLTRFLSFIYSHHIQDNCDLKMLELEVGDALLTLLVDDIVLINGDRDQLKEKLCQSLVPAIQAPGKIGKSLNLPKTADIIYNRYMYSMIQKQAGRLIGGANRWYSISFSSEDMFSKALGIQSCVEGFHGTDYSEDTIYRESIDELVLIREKKQFNKKVSRLMNVVINAFSNQNDQEWYQQLRTPSQWQIASGIRNRRLDGWLQQLESKVKNFLGDVEPVNLGWLYDPLRYLSAVNIRHLISSNLGSASTEFLITLSGIKDIHELKEGLHSGCYTNGIFLFGAKWYNNEEGPLEDSCHLGAKSDEDVVQNLGIVSLVPMESDKLKNFTSIPLHHKLSIDHTEHTFVINLRVRTAKKLPPTSSVKFLLSPNV